MACAEGQPAKAPQENCEEKSEEENCEEGQEKSKGKCTKGKERKEEDQTGKKDQPTTGKKNPSTKTHRAAASQKARMKVSASRNSAT